METAKQVGRGLLLVISIYAIFALLLECVVIFQHFGYEILVGVVAALLAFSVILNGAKITGKYLLVLGLGIVSFATFVSLLWLIVILLWLIVSFLKAVLLYAWQHLGYAIALLFVVWFAVKIIRNGVNIAVERALNIAVFACVVAMIASFGGALISVARLAWEPTAYLYALIWPGAESYVAKADLVDISFLALMLFSAGCLCLFLVVWLDIDAREWLIRQRRLTQMAPLLKLRNDTALQD